MKRHHSNNPAATYLLILILISIPLICSSQQFFVNPTGDDTNSGTKDKPVRTIARAKEKVREYNRTAGGQDITVWLAGGDYRLAETLVFGLDDGAKEGQRITYAAIPGEKPVINSDVPVIEWKKLNKMPQGLPAVSKGKIWITKVPDNIKSFNTLYDSKQALPRARTNGFSHIRKADSKEEGLYNTIPFKKDLIKDMYNPANAEIVVIPGYAWVINILPVQSVDYANGMVNLGAQSTYPLFETRHYTKTESIWVENTFAGLDSPGEWVYDKAAKLLYYWPLDSKKPGDDIVIPGLVEMIRVEGKIDYDNTTDTPVNGLRFKGIIFTHGNRFESSGQTGWGLQHDWERFDASTALIRFRGAENCAVEGCTFTNSGGTAIRFDLFSQNNTATGNDIFDLGGAGILLAGYGPGTKDVNKNNIISNNYIHHIGRLWTHSLGIWLWQSGNNLVSHNTIHDVPYSAIAVTGRIIWDRKGQGECSKTVRSDEVGKTTGREKWVERERFIHSRNNILENNDLHHVMTFMNDGNGIYISGAGKGNIARGNFIHDTPQQGGGGALRCDDDQHDVLLENNVIFRFNLLGIGLWSKGCNHFINNIVACPPDRVRLGMLTFEIRDKSKLCAGSVLRHNIYYATRADQPFISLPGMDNMIESIDTDENIYFNKSDPKAADSYFQIARKYLNEEKSIQSDPLFKDPENGDFTLLPNSPAIDLGFVPFKLNAGIQR